MNALTVAFLLFNAIALLLVPRRLAPLPLLVGTCFIPFYVSLELGSFHFTAIRVLITVGLLRSAMRLEWPHGGINWIDRAMLLWAAWLLASSAFHEEPASAFVFRLGLVLDTVGIYVLIRCWCRSLDDVSGICGLTAILLVPLAMEMIAEKVTVHNYFSAFGGVWETPLMRGDKVRASGPFGHAILAGTVGAICLPLAMALWHTYRARAIIGIVACTAIVFASASSGPILTAMASVFAMWMWHHRPNIRLLLRLAIPAYIVLDLIMKDPAYFLIARIDLAGGSTSWYRARLIQSAIEHLSEWWLVGTDHTRHWMWVVVSWSPNHTDITSHYVQMGVLGGLPLIALFILVLARVFAGVTQALQQAAELSSNLRLSVWALGSSIFAFAVTAFSVSFFDQSIAFLYLALGAIASVSSVATREQPAAKHSRRCAVMRPNTIGQPLSVAHATEAMKGRPTL